MRSVALDFETHAIDGPNPPKPVGMAYATTVRKGRYLAFAHPKANNASPIDAKKLLRGYRESRTELWFFNAGFDVPVAEKLGVKLPWSRVHDAQILAFLGNPLASSRGLKALCESELGIKPTERDELYRWLKVNIPEARRLGDAKLGAFISRAPGDLVARYAERDVTDVLAMKKHWGRFVGTEPYDRERALLPVLEYMKLWGIPIARERLEKDAEEWRVWRDRAEVWMKKRLGVRELKPRVVVAACEKKGLVEEWIETAKGGVSLAREALETLVVEKKFHDPAFVAVWGYHGYLSWLLSTFADPWLAAGAKFVRPTWNGVLQEKGGAVTGRLSSRPNAQNLPKRLPRFALPRGLGVGALPNLREYVEAPESYVFVGVDISQQELRILGHFVPTVGDWYRENPRTDVHTRVQEMIRSVAGVSLTRDHVKVVNFCTIYGGGANAISQQAKIPYAEARTFKRLHGEALPGIARWDWQMHRKPTFFTTGGREYASVEGKEYRDRNYAIQGSAADQLKVLMLAAHREVVGLGGWIVLTAHDEILTCVPHQSADEMEEFLRDLVASTGVGGSREMFDVPMLGETYRGKRWLK